MGHNEVANIPLKWKLNNMPIYQYRNPETGEIIEVIQGMKDQHEFVDDNGVKYERVFSVPNASVDTQIDPFNVDKILDKTKKKQTIGEMWDHSAELSERRAEKAGGEDPVKAEYLKNYSKKRKGKRHPGANKGKTIEVDLSKINKK